MHCEILAEQNVYTNINPQTFRFLNTQHTRTPNRSRMSKMNFQPTRLGVVLFAALPLWLMLSTQYSQSGGAYWQSYLFQPAVRAHFIGGNFVTVSSHLFMRDKNSQL